MIGYGNTGAAYELEKQLAAGGEGAVWTVRGSGSTVAKVYHQEKINSDPELESKIRYMVNNPPDKSILDQIAWPMDILRSSNGQFMGFIMPKLDTDADLKKIYPYPPKKDMPVTTEQKLIIAINICIVISEVHKAGYTFGDFNPMNIGVNLKNGHVAFFDADSYHFTDQQSGHTYRCGVGADGYIAPELIQHCHNHNTDFLNAPLPTFTKETDNFALAIHIFKLLMNGYTPFNGIKECESASQSSPGTGNLAIERDNYCFKAGNKPQSPATPNMASLSPDIQYLFKKTFEGGVKNPQNRATAEEWKDALIEYKDQLTKCKNNPMHYYYVSNSKCPYCEADQKYQQSLAGVSQTYATGSCGNSQVSFSNPINVPLTTQTSRSNAYQGGYQQNAAKSVSQNTLLRVLLWIFFFPIMLIIKVWKSKMGILGKLIISAIILSLSGSVLTSCSSGLANLGGGGSSTPNYNLVVENGLRFEKVDSTYVVSADPDSMSTLSGEIQIPNTCKDLPVVAIKESGFAGCSNITSVTIPDSVTSIGISAFSGCTKLENISIPAKVTEIPEKCFENCTGLQNISIPEHVISIGYASFAGCSGLTDMTLPFVGKSETAVGTEAVFGYIFGFEESKAENPPELEHSADTVKDHTSLVNVAPPERVGYVWQCSVYYDTGWGGQELTYYFYEIPTSLRNITITKQATVPPYAFNGCNFLETISFTADMAKNSAIGSGAYQNCSSWVPGTDGILVVPDNCISIGSNAFTNCVNIKEVVVTDYVREIGKNAFAGCENIVKMTLPFIGKTESAQGTEAVLGYIFGYQKVEQENPASHKTRVEEYKEYYFTINLRPNSLVGYTWQTTTYYDAYGWSDPEVVFYYYQIPETLETVVVTKQMELHYFAFNNCTMLTSVVLPQGCTYLDYAFQDCPAAITTQ